MADMADMADMATQEEGNVNSQISTAAALALFILAVFQVQTVKSLSDDDFKLTLKGVNIRELEKVHHIFPLLQWEALVFILVL